MKRALITGINGQDGNYLAELLLEKGYSVFGAVRRNDDDHLRQLDPLRDRIRVVQMDLLDQESIDRAIGEVEPHEIYNLAAQSSVAQSWQQPVLTGEINGTGVARLLDSIVTHVPDARFFQASSSEMFSRSGESPQKENTPFEPHSPYGISKLYAHHLTGCYRQRFGLFAASGILFNHESPRRGPQFVTRKVTRAAAEIALGLSRELRLGQLEARRDWGAAPDFARAMWLMLQADEPTDYVIGTGIVHTVEELVDAAFSYLGLDWHKYVVIDPSCVRPAEPVILRADASKARNMLRWKPEISFGEMVRMMVDAELASLKRQLRATPTRKAA